MSDDKIESVAVTASMGEPLPSSVESVMSSQKKTKKSKFKAVVAAVAATQGEDDALHNLCVDHPYLSVLYKRIRSHRKKLEKIKGLEEAQATKRKVLNAQQLELVSNKAPLEKLVGELEMLREQFVVVFSHELEQKQQQSAVKSPAKDMWQMKEREVGNEAVKQEEGAQEMEKKEVQVDETVEDFANVYDVLKTLHVVNLHHFVGKEVPMVLDYFSKVLLGNTRPPAELSYEENLLESLEEAKKYLLKSDKVFACDTTYHDLRAFVDQLANMSATKLEDDVVLDPGDKTENSVAVLEETLDVPVVPAEINMMPQISFFTESQLESEQSNKSAAKVEVAEAQAELIPVGPREVIEKNKVGIEEHAEAVSTSPLSFAAVAAGVSSERTLSPYASSGSSGNDKKELDSGGNSPRGKNSRRRGQGRWKEKGSNSNNGGNKSGSGSPTRPRRSRAPRTNNAIGGVQGRKRSGSKEAGRSRGDRGLAKQQNNSCQEHTSPMIAPHA